MPRGKASPMTKAEDSSAPKTPPPSIASKNGSAKEVAYITIRVPVLLSTDDQIVSPERPALARAQLGPEERRAQNALVKAIQKEVINKDWGSRSPVWSHSDAIRWLLGQIEDERKKLISE